jgi:hypothetical protein
VFARGVDLNIALRGTFEYCSNVPHVSSMILILILEETRGAYKYFRTEKCFART